MWSKKQIEKRRTRCYKWMNSVGERLLIVVTLVAHIVQEPGISGGRKSESVALQSES